METIEENEMKGAIERSGYVLEGRVIRKLADNGYHVLPSERYADSRTGIDREIDVVGISPIIKGNFQGVDLSINHQLIIECTNNPQPIVFFDIDGNGKLVETHSPFVSWSTDGDSEVMRKLRNFPGFELTHSGNFFMTETPSVQYCSFVQKKGTKEWMALHPDDVHTMMTKFKDYLEKQMAAYDSIYSQKENMFRHIIFRMVWVTSNDIYIASQAQGKVELTKRDMVFYLHKFSERNLVKDIIIDVVTETFLERYLALNLAVDVRLASKIEALD